MKKEKKETFINLSSSNTISIFAWIAIVLATIIFIGIIYSFFFTDNKGKTPTNYNLFNGLFTR